MLRYSWPYLWWAWLPAIQSKASEGGVSDMYRRCIYPAEIPGIGNQGRALRLKDKSPWPPCLTVLAPANVCGLKAYCDDEPSSMIIKPKPIAKTPNPVHITGRYCPVRETTIPEKAEVTEAPREYDNILCLYDEYWNSKFTSAVHSYSIPALVADAPSTW